MAAVHPSLQALPGLLHAFCPGQPVGVRDWSAAAAAAGAPGMPVARVRQVHGAAVRYAESGGDLGEADAVFTDRPGLLVAVVTADCVPVLVAGGGMVAAIHAGWRGVAAGIIGETLRTMSATGPLTAVVGPCIRVDAYETGEEVVSAVVEAGVPEEVVAVRRPGWPRAHADIAAAARWQLRHAGCAVVEDVGLCTWTDRRFESHRRDGARSGRQISLIGQRP